MASNAPYIKIDCIVCGQQISRGGLARTSHYRKHVKEGRMVERPICYEQELYRPGRYGRTSRLVNHLEFLPVKSMSDFTKKTAIALGQVGYVLKNDTHHQNIGRAARELINTDRKTWEYIRQYSTGTTLWRNPETSEAILIEGEPTNA